MTTTAASFPEYLFLALSSLSYTTIVLTIVAAAAIAYSVHMNTCHDDWTRYGIKCPKLPNVLVIGNDFRIIFADLIRQYGDIIGLYGRNRMLLLTTNFDLIRHILIKDFNNFVDRSDNFMSSSSFAKSLFFATGSDWRRHRQIVSPTFTTGKLKYISKSVDKSAQDLTDYLETFAKSGKLVPIKDICGQYTSEIIAKTAFGLDAKFIGQDDSEFYEYAKNMIRFDNPTGIMRLIHFFLTSIPHLVKFTVKFLKLQYFDPINMKADKYFQVVLRNTIAGRRLQKKDYQKSRVDFLDLLLRANDAAAAGQLKPTEEEFQSSDWGIEGKSVQSLTDSEMIGHSMLVIFAGMETTATTFQMCLYELAANPDIQEKVYQEITAVVKSEVTTPEELNSLSYTEQVINETLRIYPPVSLVNRLAKETRTYNGVTIPKGTIVQIPYYYIMTDPKIFPEPDKFNPNRFSPEEKEKRDPLSFSAFGHGPRLCLGMRLAYLELKQGLVHVLKKLKVVLNENTEPKMGSGKIKISPRGLLTPEKTIMLAFELRQPSEEN